MIDILLLDCDRHIETSLKNKGFSVNSGSLGFDTGVQNIPVALYEQNIIFFNPTDVEFASEAESQEKDGSFYIPDIENVTPEIHINDIKDFLSRSGLLVIFMNELDISGKREQAIYSWIPKVPYCFSTSDTKLDIELDPEDKIEQAFRPIFRDLKIKTPVKRSSHYHRDYQYPKVFCRNKRGDILASLYTIDGGYVVLLPEFESNLDVINHIATHVYPCLFEVSPDIPDFLNLKKTTKAIVLEKKLKDEEANLKKATSSIKKIREDLVIENNMVEKILQKDQTSIKLMGYLRDMLEDKRNSWYPAYKIKEAISDVFGGEKGAKQKLGHNSKFNYIKKIANESNRDTRHPPRQGEVVNPPSEEEVEKITKYTIQLVESYFNFFIAKSR